MAKTTIPDTEPDPERRVLDEEIKWFKEVLKYRIATLSAENPGEIPPTPTTSAKAEIQYKNIEDIPCPDLRNFNCPYSQTILKEKLSKRERLVILLTLMPMLAPEVLDVFFTLNTATERPFTEFGTSTNATQGCFTPTLQTAIFLVGGRKWEGRLQAAELFSPTSNYPVLKMVDIKRLGENDHAFQGWLTLKKTYHSQLIEGKPYFPRFSSEFPATRLSTPLSWSDLVLDHETKSKVQNILNWLRYNDDIQEGSPLKARIKPGYKALFYGPPGTGKSLTAALLGKVMHKDVFKIDVSQVNSKFIGETEKNLANIFDQAEDKNWILLFDEADALFGKRVNTSSSNDQHLNLQVAYLLQRIEDYPGVVILTSNFKSNIDQAFSRRFKTIAHFPMPDADARLKLWQAAISSDFPLAEGIDLKQIAKKHLLTGGTIVNVLHYAVLSSIAEGLAYISEDHLTEGIRLEFAKEGKTIS